MDVQFTIVEPQHLNDLCAQARQAGFVGIDTEFVRRRTFFPELGLIQLNIADRVYLLDPLAGFALDELKLTLAQVEWLLHSGSEDFEVLLQVGFSAPSLLFDTQLAAAFCGLGGQLSYQALCAKCLEIDVAKDETQSDWLKRPLSTEQLSYAAADVHHLPALRVALSARLEALERMSWFESEQATRLRTLSAPGDAVDEFKRYRQAVKLKPVQQQRLLRIIQWREQEARARNLPRAWVLEHGVLIDWAERPPKDAHRLRADLNERNYAARRAAEDLLALLHDDPAEPLAVLHALDASQSQRLNALKKIAGERALELNLPLEVLAPRKILENLACNPDLPVGQWRRELLGLG